MAGVALPGAAAARTDSWNFVSAPGLHPPKLQVLMHKRGVARGYFLATGSPAGYGHAGNQGGPLIMDSRARPIWFLPTRTPPFGLQQEIYQGRPVLVWFREPGYGRRGMPHQAVRAAEFVVYDEHYRKIAVIKARSPWMTDLHDAWITGGDIWITVNRIARHQNLTPYGGPADGAVQDVGLQEFQISTGQLIRTWDALNPRGRANVPLSASEEPASGAWDAYHLNSVQALADGDLLVSMRNTWAVYLIDPITGRTEWTLGGKDSSFTIGHHAWFAWQHDARLVTPWKGGRGRDVELTLFNDDNGNRPNHSSEGMVLRLNTVSHLAALVQAYHHHPPLQSVVMGSMQLLPNGNALVGWGSEPFFSEYSNSGKELLDVEWPGGAPSYRVLFSDSWVGTPYYPPSGAVRGGTVYASWNGATEVDTWEVLAGSSTGDLKMVGSQARTGFETAVKLSRSYRVYEVRAVGARGQVLGTSAGFS